jgi:hypothetical protein
VHCQSEPARLRPSAIAIGDARTIPITGSRKLLMGCLRSGMEQQRSPYILTEICQAAGLERSVLPPLDSRKHTKAKRLIIATSSAPDRSQDGELARNGPTATSEKRNATTVPHINMRNPP